VEATKNFDEERVHANGAKAVTFELGGEKFTIREYVSAEVLAVFGRRQVANFGDTMEAYDEFVKECVVPGDAEKWDKVRAEADPPLTVGAVERVLWWIMDQVTDRPTEASSSSRRGRAAPVAT
jgi:hypothetical protein